MHIEALSSERLDRAAAIHMEAFRGYPNVRLGIAYAKALLNWFHRYDQGVTLVAVDEDGQAVGYVAGAFLPYGEKMNRDLFPLVAAITITRPWIICNLRFFAAAKARLASMLRPTRSAVGAETKLPEPIMSLVAIGTAETARGRGIASALIMAFEEQARRRGAQCLRLSVYPENTAARRVYERCGWAIVAEPSGGRAIYYRKILATEPQT